MHVVPSLGFGFLPFSIAVLVISTTLAVELHTKYILLIFRKVIYV